MGKHSLLPHFLFIEWSVRMVEESQKKGEMDY